MDRATDLLTQFANLVADQVLARLPQQASDNDDQVSDLSTDQVANRLGVCTLTVRNWAKAGCPHFTIGKGRKRFDLTAVKAWLAARDGGVR